MQTDIIIKVSGQMAKIISAPPVLVAGSEALYRAVFDFGPEWADINHRRAVFRAYRMEVGADIVDGACIVPAQVLIPNTTLAIGVNGVATGAPGAPNIRTPTIWAELQDPTRAGASSAPTPAPVSPRWYDGLGIATAEGFLRVTVDGEGVGEGVYIQDGVYTPSIMQTSEDSATVTFAPSNPWMPQIPEANLTLPRGTDGKPGGVAYVSFDVDDRGHLIVTTQEDSNALIFSVDDQGHLIVDINGGD